MINYICITCGAYYLASSAPEGCKICLDERQYVNHQGQTWTTLPKANAKYDVVMKREEQHLYGIGIEPRFAIGQRALLLQTPHGNILYSSDQ